MASTATKIPAELKRQVDAAIAQYPRERKRSAALPLLHLWQEHFGFISDEGINWIAEKLELQTDQHSRIGNLLSDVAAKKSWQNPYSRLPDA